MIEIIVFLCCAVIGWAIGDEIRKLFPERYRKKELEREVK